MDFFLYTAFLPITDWVDFFFNSMNSLSGFPGNKRNFSDHDLTMKLGEFHGCPTRQDSRQIKSDTFTFPSFQCPPCLFLAIC